MSETDQNYGAYLLRLWRDAEGEPWRASLQEAQTGREFAFSSMAQLFAFLKEQTAGARTQQSARQ